MESGHHRNARFVGKIPEAHDHGAGAMLEERARQAERTFHARAWTIAAATCGENHDSDATQFLSPNDTGIQASTRRVRATRREHDARELRVDPI